LSQRVRNVPVYFSIIIIDQYVDTNFVLFSISFLTGKTPIKRVKLNKICCHYKKGVQFTYYNIYRWDSVFHLPVDRLFTIY